MGDEHPETAESLHQLGALHFARGDYAESRTLLLSALSLRTGPGPTGTYEPAAAATLLYLGNVELQAGKDSLSRALLDSARVILERDGRGGSSELAWTLNSIGALDVETGDMVSAAESYREAARVLDRACGRRHPLYATILHNMGIVEAFLGNHVESRRHFEEALRLRRELLGGGHPLVASTALELGLLLQETGHPKHALSMLQEARRTLGDRGDGLTTAWAELYLGMLFLDLREPDKALLHLRNARDRRADILGSGHPDIARVRIQIARAIADGGDWELAAHEFRDAISTLKHHVGRRAEVAEALGYYASHLARYGDPVAAMSAGLEAESIARDDLRVLSEGLAERQALRRATVRMEALGVVVQLAIHHARERPDFVVKAWDAVMKSRALVLDAMTARHRAAQDGDSTGKLILQDLAKRRERLAFLVLRGSERSGDSYDTRLHHAQEAVERAERALAAHTKRSLEPPKADEVSVRRSMPPGSALGAFLRYHSSGSGPREASYAVFIAGAVNEHPTVVSLGSAPDIEASVTRWSRDIVRGARRGVTASEEAVCRLSGAALRRRVWDPLVPWLRGAGTVFLVPDGMIHAVNFEALPRGASAYVIDSLPVIHYLTAERRLLGHRHASPPGSGLLAVGSPSYDDRPSGWPERGRPGTTRDSGSAQVRSNADCASLEGSVFQPLPHSRDEVEEIASVWKASTSRAEPGSRPDTAIILLSRRASEAEAKRLAPGRRIVHFATHGFVLGSDCPEGSSGGRGMSATVPRRPQRRVIPKGADPLLLAGLAFAGANLRSEAPSGGNDGILTAAEAISLDLSGVEWVVLSACETGRGSIQNGEGVLGLLRAFEIAGSAAVIYSLWPVGDREAKDWMRACYRRRLEEGASTAQAVRGASAAMLASRRARGVHTHPAVWAGFVATGGWN